MQHEIPERQWERVGADVFELEGTPLSRCCGLL